MTRSVDGAPGGHLHALDVVRLLTLLGVIAAHSTALADGTGSDGAGEALVVLHLTREVFVLLSAFVLTYSYLGRPAPAASFWARRFPLVALPYAVWSAIYVLADGHLRSVGDAVATYTVDLADSGAQFHLYFLLLTFQLYLVFPALLAVVLRHPRVHLPLLGASAAFQVGFTSAVHYGWRPPVLGRWLDHPGSWLPSYELYIVAGVLGALHLEAVTAWVRGHGRATAAGLAGSVLLALTSYRIDVSVLGYRPVRAGEVFQPVVVIEAVGAVLAQYSLGLWVTDRLRTPWARRLERSSDVSFGVYLAHPLIIGVLLEVAVGAGGTSAVRHPSGGLVAVIVVALVVCAYVVSFAAMAGVRRTRLSLALSGRRFRPDTKPAELGSRPAGIRG